MSTVAKETTEGGDGDGIAFHVLSQSYRFRLLQKYS